LSPARRHRQKAFSNALQERHVFAVRMAGDTGDICSL
jgi:hypothetical protein